MNGRSIGSLFGLPDQALQEHPNRGLPEAQVMELRRRSALYWRMPALLTRGVFVREKAGLETTTVAFRHSGAVMMFWRRLCPAFSVHDRRIRLAYSTSDAGAPVDCLVALVGTGGAGLQYLAFNARTLEIYDPTLAKGTDAPASEGDR